MQGVPWRRAILAVVAAVLALTGVVVALRADGYPAIDATTAQNPTARSHILMPASPIRGTRCHPGVQTDVGFALSAL